MDLVNKLPPTLEILDLSWNNIDDVGLNLMIKTRPSTLATLKLSNNGIVVDDMKLNGEKLPSSLWI